MENIKKTINKKFTGEVVSNKMNKTIVVKVNSVKMHAKYGKYYQVSKKYHVHDEKGDVKIGDKVEFVECRPLSKTKRWTLVRILNK
ncbi:MAG: 30S ribosomal protein S17 [Patescibacteria group bacterium]|jgi:small subunit ribosomal protein S17|nr:30S ribosomal protein S17 [Patescibacteria group bacterium]